MQLLKKNAKGSVKVTSDENSTVKELLRLEKLFSAGRLTRKRLLELNESAKDASSIIVLKDIDVCEIINLRRRVMKEARLKGKLQRAVRKQGKALELNTTATSSRDFITPEVDSPVKEALRKEILEKLNKSVTKRQPKSVPKTSTETPISQNSSSSSNQRPRRLVKTTNEESRSLNFVHKQFDDLNTDDESDDDYRGNTRDLPEHWTKYAKGLARVQAYLNEDLPEVLFRSDQVFNINPRDLFPNTGHIERRRSSMWEDP